MNKFEMPKMDIARFSKENIITASGDATSTAKQRAMNVLKDNNVDETNIFEFILK